MVKPIGHFRILYNKESLSEDELIDFEVLLYFLGVEITSDLKTVL